MAIYFKLPEVKVVWYRLVVNTAILADHILSHEDLCAQYRLLKKQGHILDTDTVQYFNNADGPWHCYNAF